MKKRDEGNSERGGAEIGAELEARVVAWVAGEASAFEAAELARIAAERPEVAAFKAEMERVHGLVGAAMQGEAEPLRMSAERRAKVLAALGRGGVAEKEKGTEAEGAEGKVAVFPQRAAWRRVQWMIGVAATLAIGAFGIWQWEYRREDAKPMELAAGAASDREVAVWRKEARDREVAVKQAIELEEKRRAGARQPAQDAPARGAPEFKFTVPIVQTKDVVTEAVAQQAVGGAMPAKKEGLVLPSVGPAKTKAAADGMGTVGAVVLNASAVELPIGQAGMDPRPVAMTLEPPAAPAPLNDVTGASDKRVFDASVTTIATERMGFGGKPSVATTGQVTFGAPAAEPVMTLDAFEVQSPERRIATAGFVTRGQLSLGRANGEMPASAEAVSTFSLHVSDVSFRLAQGVLAAIERGEQPGNAALRAEEFYNGFDYGDPLPSEREKVAARIEQARHPVLQERNLLRIGVRVAATGRAANQPLRLTLLLDTSGSMEREDRRAAVRRALAELVALLGPEDRVTLIGFARQPRLLAEDVPGNQAGELVRLAAEVPADGGTNLEEALKLAGDVALRRRSVRAQNRIVVLTDGAANLGDAQPERLMALVEAIREQGVAVDACGVGLEGAGDAVLEAMTRKGNGRYYVLDRPEAADAGFARKLAGAFRPAAENVKVQVRFNPARVGAYRLIGFEQHRLNAEDFRNDKVDAAELAAEEGAVAMYQVEPLAQGTGDLGEVSVRFREPASGEMVERTWAIPYEAGAPALERASPSMQLASVAAMLGEVMTESEVGEALKPGELVPVVNQLRGHYPNQARVEELVRMFEQVRRWKRE